MKHCQAYLIDLGGTMYRGTDEIDGVVQFIDYLNNSHVPHLYVISNSTKTPTQVTKKSHEIHIDAKPDEVVTSALTIADYVPEQHPDATIYMIDGHGLKTTLTDAGLSIENDEHVDYVVISLDEKVTYEKLSIATLAIHSGVRFISTSPDVSIPEERGFLPGNGTIMSVISVSAGIQPELIGKPGSIIMSKSLDVPGLEKSEVAMVDDLYGTGIMSGINVGIDTVHVQTGVDTYEDIQSREIPPTYSSKGLNVAITELEK